MIFSDLLLFSILGYFFAFLGIIFGFTLLASIFHPKQNIHSKIIESEESKEIITEDELYSVLDDLADNETLDCSNDDEVFYQTESNAINEPISYIDIKKCFDDENSIEVYRKKEDNSYAVLRKKIKI